MNLIAFFVLFTFSISSYANINVKSVNVNCGKGVECKNIKNNFKTLKRAYVGFSHLDTVLKLYTLNSGIKNFNYKLVENNLIINLKPKLKIHSVKISPSDLSLPSILPTREDEFFDDSKVTKTKSLIVDLYRSKGFPNVSVADAIKMNKDNSIDISFKVDKGRAIKISKIQIISKSQYIYKLINKKLSVFENKPFNVQEIKASMEEVKGLLVSYGYYLVDLNLKYFLLNYKVELFVKVLGTSQHVYTVNDLPEYKEEIKELLRSSTITYKRKLSNELIRQLIVEFYEKKGFLEPQIIIKEKTYLTNLNDQTSMVSIDIVPNKRSYLESLEFKGNNIISSERLVSLFYEQSTEQVENNIYDKKYYNEFIKLLKEEYIKLGYVNVFVDIPDIEIMPKSKGVKLIYRVREGVKAFVKKIEIKGVEESTINKILSIIKTKVDERFNPIQFKLDLDIALNHLKEEGYYFVTLNNLNSSSLVSYTRDNSLVKITLDFSVDKKYFVNDVIIVGNTKTRSKLIEREINLIKDSKVTSKNIDSSRRNLLSTGLFSSVLITPIKNKTNKADILISLKEKDFGVIELAPGIRTDLGPKISTKIAYNNIDGLNKQLSFKGQVNKRENLNTLSEERREKAKSSIEYLALVNYSEKYLFNSDWTLGISLSQSRRRYFSFDADIQKTSYTLGNDLTSWLKFNFTQQLETISQYDTTVDREHGHFQIGSVTPELIFDFRNNRINPTKGSYFNLSYEVASPAFLSQSNDELEINYYKLTSRNRFYIPFRNGVLALSLSAGFQKNLATQIRTDSNGVTESEGYIPNIKVFRLAGMDIVRGFEDNEINRLVTGEDVSEARVDSKAYMANLKFEPRFYLSDSTMLGVFYDAGRVFVDTFNLDELRSSVGLSFKYLTPVGSLDFDYGIKLLRKKDNNGKLESPGRLHVSIGFF
jgi:outer membrane protein insertion porin family